MFRTILVGSKPALLRHPSLPVVVVVCALCSAAAQAQQAAPWSPATETGSNDAPLIPDKGGYTLFNPTPDDKLREFSTDRPGKSHSSTTVDAGHLQIESDFVNYTYDPLNSAHPGTQALSVASPLFRLGLTNWIELQVATALFNTLRQNDGSNITRGHGFGDIGVGGKINLFGNDGGDQSLAIIPFIKVPTAAPNLGNRYIEGSVSVSYTVALTKPWSLTLEPNFGVVRNIDNTGYRENYGFLANLNRPVLIEGLTAAAEVAVDVSSQAARTRVSLDPSLQYLITKTVQIDAGVYFGLTKYSPRYNPYVGISARF